MEISGGVQIKSKRKFGGLYTSVSDLAWDGVIHTVLKDSPMVERIIFSITTTIITITDISPYDTNLPPRTHGTATPAGRSDPYNAITTCSKLVEFKSIASTIGPPNSS